LHKISDAAFKPENIAVSALLRYAEPLRLVHTDIENFATALVEKVRAQKNENLLEEFLNEYSLDTSEGIVIMCLAEALLRIPDSETADRLIHDKMKFANFRRHIGESSSALVNASTWALMLSGKVVSLEDSEGGVSAVFGRMVARLGEPVIRSSLKAAMRIVGSQFVLGEDISDAIKKAASDKRYLYSYDVLGEGARTDEQALKYIAAYENAIDVIGRKSPLNDNIMLRDGISIKLSALHPRYESLKKERVMAELIPRIKNLVMRGIAANIPITLDAEEASRLEISLEVFTELMNVPEIAAFAGFGLAVQAYQKRAFYVLDYIVSLAEKAGRKIPVRLVKGAYWDAEIKRAQMLGLEGYPVFTCKQHTDISYMACARKMFEKRDYIYSQFATHNSHTMACVKRLFGSDAFEFQRLHGMGEGLYNQLVGEHKVRVYAPVGKHADLLAYLIRRLLENGANTSFLNLLVDKTKSTTELAANPMDIADTKTESPNFKICLPDFIYGAERKNSGGLDLGYSSHKTNIDGVFASFATASWNAESVIGGKNIGGEKLVITEPANTAKIVGYAYMQKRDGLVGVVDAAERGFIEWRAYSPAKRSDIIRKAADVLEEHADEALALLVREAGKTIYDAIAEVREAVDFFRYYANEAERLSAPTSMVGYTGESSDLWLHGRGIFACVAPWNFPLAIFTGQVVAALVTGNSVIAKPAEETPLIAALIVKILHSAGVPVNALNLVLTAGSDFGAGILTDARIAGVAFTGSTETARIINRTLAGRDAPIAALIAETGGQNAMIVDSSALLEQVVDDVISSSFHSAGQRCSALRVLYVQSDIADNLLAMLIGALKEVEIGNPLNLSTDVGPVISRQAQDDLISHIINMTEKHKLLFRASIPDDGYFVPPTIVEIPSINVLTRENFGPILHVVRYESDDIESVIADINASGYGLTLGVHSRLEGFAKHIAANVRAGNVYINRSMTGAVVGFHPFGGEGLSGTGPKAGGPLYLLRFISEKTITTNTAAIGGNLQLLS